CGKCNQNADCAVGTHPGPFCNVQTGSCGTGCQQDSDCTAVQWCNTGTCQPRLPNGDPVPGDTCNATLGMRACLSGACDANDKRCGLPNGELCQADAICRSGDCFTDGRCGRPVNEPCTSAPICRVDVCGSDGTCGLPNNDPCTSDAVCRTGVCFDDKRCGAPIGEGCSATSVCRIGQCRDRICINEVDGGIIDGETDAGVDAGTIVSPGPDAGAAGGAGGADDTTAMGGTPGTTPFSDLRVGGGGCNCGVSGNQADKAGSLLLFLLVTLQLLRRKRKP
ncbi:MAG: MYXO-CTERM sorting domain-containing protein, partial [Deltaproteobacteria bacterium]|nr:MYXO-CTERM sorting domain-containing protein [Deltaproteobacteria bacterium]